MISAHGFFTSITQQGSARTPVAHRVFAIAALVLSILAVPLHARQTGDTGRLLVRIETKSIEAVTAKLQAAGYDVVRVDVDHSAIDLAVTRSEWVTLRSKGYNVTVLDRTRPLRDSPASHAPSAPARPAAVADATTYLDLDGIVARMREIAAAFPTIARFVDITTTYQTPPTVEGRHLFALKISDNVDVDEDEPAMLIVSAHHAREISTPVIALATAERLTSGYGSDPRITLAVDSHEIWIAPVWNPDGYTYVFTTDNMWRKNRRVFSTGVGVDQNRNYSQGWATSCARSTSVSSETYKGPSAVSEAETQTMMTWSARERFAKIIDYHSYGREVLFSYRCLNHPFTSWMQQEAAAISQASGYGGLTRIPNAEGEHPQWQFAQMGAYAFLIETQTEFQPPYQGAVAEASLVWPGILSVLERPISVTGHVTDAATGAPLHAKIELLGVAFSQGETNSSGGVYGAYHMFMPPGTYSVRYSAPGYSPVITTVTVTASSSVVNEVQLSVAPPRRHVGGKQATRATVFEERGGSCGTVGRPEGLRYSCDKQGRVAPSTALVAQTFRSAHRACLPILN